MTEKIRSGGARRKGEEAGLRTGGVGGSLPSPLDESAARNGVVGSTGEIGEGSGSSGAAAAKSKGKMAPPARRRRGRFSANTTAVSGVGGSGGPGAAEELLLPSFARENAGAGATGTDEHSDRASPSFSLSALEDGYHNRLTCTICSSGAELRPVTLTGGWGRGSMFSPRPPPAAASLAQPAAAPAATAAALSLQATQSLLADHLADSTLVGSSTTRGLAADGKDGGRSGPVGVTATAVSFAATASSVRSGSTAGGGGGTDSIGRCDGGGEDNSSSALVNSSSTTLSNSGSSGGNEGVKPLPAAVVNEEATSAEALEATAVDGCIADGEEGAGASASAKADNRDGGEMTPLSAAPPSCGAAVAAATASAATVAAESSVAVDAATVTSTGGAVRDASSCADATGQALPITSSSASVSNGTGGFPTLAGVSVGVVGGGADNDDANASASAPVVTGVGDGGVDGRGQEKEQEQVGCAQWMSGRIKLH